MISSYIHRSKNVSYYFLGNLADIALGYGSVKEYMVRILLLFYFFIWSGLFLFFHCPRDANGSFSFSDVCEKERQTGREEQRDSVNVFKAQGKFRLFFFLYKRSDMMHKIELYLFLESQGIFGLKINIH